jgi:hypothetical protein
MNYPSTLPSRVAIVAAACISGFSAGFFAPAPALATTLDPSSLVWAARTCYLEASFNEPDCLALLWVARKKAARVERPWIEVLRDYSSIRVDTPRSKEISEFPWGDVPGKSDRFNERWQQLRELVTEFEQGVHADPCPSAEHWGGSMDAPQGRMIKARCAMSTRNTFYAIGARSRVRFARDEVSAR